MRNRTIVMYSIGLLAVTLAAGCAQQVGDIDRTQPNKVEKEVFEGEWYFRQTVVDVNGTAVSTFVGLQGNMERVLFEVEEDFLVAYRTHEDVIGIDSQSLGEGEEFEHGQPVVAFPIQGHFDVQRQYNSSTGEQSNVIVENGSDRPWYERDYVRIDWSTNQVVTVYTSMTDLAQVANLRIRPQNEGDEPTWFMERNEDGEVVYIDALSTFIMEPDFIECILEFGFPLYGGFCGPETVTVRSSFVKITDESDFVAREYTDHEMNDFGFFRTERAGYDPNYGTRDANRSYRASIWNIWENSHDADGNVLPYDQRDPRPVVYYLSAGFPDDYKDIAFEVAQQYDNAFRRVVAAHRGIDIPSDPGAMTEVSYDDVPRMFYLCENPGGVDSRYESSIEGYQNGICQRPGEVKSIGDLRYSYMAWVDQPQQVGPGGYGPSDPDPLTGELISGNAFVYGWVVRYYAAYGLDLAKMLTGELDPEEYGHGTTIEDYFDRLAERTGDDAFFGQLQERSERAAHVRRAIDRRMQDPRTRLIDSLDPRDFRLTSQADLNPFERIRGTELERRALFPEMLDRMRPPESQAAILAGDLAPDAPLTDEEVDFMSIANVGDPINMLREYDRRTTRYTTFGPSQTCVYQVNFDDPTIVGLATELAEEREELRAQGLDTDEIDALQRTAIGRGFFRGLLAHEVGHTVGLRHNFEASMDALNYGLEYWRLRERTFDTCDEDNITFANDGFYSGQVAPPLCGDAAFEETVQEYNRRNADLLQELLEARIHDLQYASTMDYSGHISSDWKGLGLYDYAAVAYGYGELVEIFNEAPHKIYVETEFDPDSDDYMGSEIRRSNQRIRTFDDVDEYVIRRRGRTLGDDPAYLRDEEEGQEHNHEWYHYSTLPMMFTGNVEAMYNRSLVPQSSVGDSVVVPYRFCSDEYYGSSIECSLWDQGADHLEIFQNLLDTWDEYYVLSHFRRGRAGFGLWIYPHIQRVFGRTMAPMTRLYQYWLLKFSGRGVAWANESWGGDDATVAAFAAVDFLGNVVTTPAPGTYYYDEDEAMYMNLDEELGYRAPLFFEVEENIDPDTDYLEVGIDVGRHGYEHFRRNEDDEGGYYYFLETEIMSWFWTKWAAMMALVLPTVDVIGADTASDATAYSIPIYIYFEDELTQFFGAIPQENYDVLGTCVGDMMQDREASEIMRRNLATGAPSDCDSARALNPYTFAYGNADFNMRLLSILYASAYFQSNYSQNWFDRSNVYILGRGYNVDPGDGYVLSTYEHHNGLTYAAVVPEVMEDGQEDTLVGMQLIDHMHELRAERDALLESEGETSEYFSVHFELESLLEDVRLLNQANQIFEGYNVFLPFTL